MKKNNLKMMLCALVVMALSVCFVSCSKDDDKGNPPVPQKAKYTIMFYGCAGGNLDVWLENTIPYIVQALKANNNQVRFTVMFNTSKDDSRYKKNGVTPNFLGDWATCYRYEITPEIDLTKEGYRSKYKYKNASEVELYKTQTLVEYINWVKETAPAENYILMPMNHGGGTDLAQETRRAIGYDDNHYDSASKYYFGIGERAIAEALKQTNTHLKAIYWCGCLMGQLEVLTQLAPYCDYQFCSSHVSRAIEGLIYEIIYAINQSPNDFEKAALIDLEYKKTNYNKYFVQVASGQNGTVHDENCDWGCWRSNKLAAINDQVKKLTTLVCESLNEPTAMPKIDNATAHTYVFEFDCHFADVLDFAVNVAERLEGESKATANQIVTDMEKALNDAKVYRIDGLNIVTPQKIAPKKGFFSLGISIYSSSEDTWEKYSENYKATDFDKATGWSKFLDMNTVPIMESATNPSNNSTYEFILLDI